MTEQRHINPWLIAVSVMFATFMEVLDTTVVNVSLPHIAGSLSVTIDEATWALTSYLVANAIILPMTGWLASVFGRKRLLMLSVVGLPAAGPRQGDGLLGARHRRRADHGAGARRLADRQLQLALGLLHQHPGRHRVNRDDQALHLRPGVPADRV